MKLIDADNIIEYPTLDTVNIEDEYTNIIFNNLPGDVIIENEEELMNLCKNITDMFMNVVKTEKIIDPVRHGKWIYRPHAYDWNIGGWCCSRCGFTNSILDNHEKTDFSFQFIAGARYCPCCGAKMDKED